MDWRPTDRAGQKSGYFVNGLPRLDAVVEPIGVDEELQWLKFEAGEIDVSAIPPASFPT